MAKAYIMITMSSALQLEHQSLETTATIMRNLEELFGESDRSVRFVLMRKLMSSNMTEGSSVREHVLGMINHFNELDVLGGRIEDATKVDMVLHTLPKSYENFRLNAVYLMGMVDPSFGGLNHLAVIAIEWFSLSSWSFGSMPLNLFARP
ncbi:uncharacterized protein LOC130995216 [Salvia miltiorrhiza]|uniref:uncharacterized protein LOC130995216 n=1 Tax=Salvia miltiorrhiza TaxID=226208 RepID=UPI0025AC63F0|nr:uncharacterized protein LOC130995216 [Salvia miltiorrhiza]